MPGTRGAADTKTRASRRGKDSPETDASLCLNSAQLNPLLTDPDATVALAVEYREWKVPPSIGQIEAVFTAEGRTQHRIWRIDVGAESAVVHVHPSDVAGCVGLIGTGDLKVSSCAHSLERAHRRRGCSARTPPPRRARLRAARLPQRTHLWPYHPQKAPTPQK